MSSLTLEQIKLLIQSTASINTPPIISSPYEQEKERLTTTKVGYQPIFQVGNLNTIFSSIQQSEKLREAENRLDVLNRHITFFFGLIGNKTIEEKLISFCPYTPERQDWIIVFKESRSPSLYDYHHFLESIDTFYKLIVSFAKPEYFKDFWLNGKQIQIAQEDDLRVIEISKHSPDNLVLSGLALVLKSIADIFSIGNQYVGIRTANIKIREAEIDLEQKELTLTKSKKEAEYKKRVQAEEIYLDLEKKRLEVDRLKSEVEQEKLRLQEQKIAQVKSSLDLLSSTYKLLDVVPQEMQQAFVGAVVGMLETSYESPYEIIKFSIHQKNAT